jgi:hypothetical protein
MNYDEVMRGDGNKSMNNSPLPVYSDWISLTDGKLIRNDCDKPWEGDRVMRWFLPGKHSGSEDGLACQADMHDIYKGTVRFSIKWIVPMPSGHA